MKIHFCCPECGKTSANEFDESTEQLACVHCENAIAAPEDAFKDGLLARCMVCPSDELFIRKDFPQQLGLGIIVCGFVLSSIAWYFYQVYLAFGILFATALIDAGLYIWMGSVVACYRCHAEYRGADDDTGFAPFDLEIHEKHRQQAARLAEASSTQSTSESG